MTKQNTRSAAPDHDCRLCPRLAAFRDANRQKFPDMFNAPVPSFGTDNPKLLIIGLAPGLRGANFTGRPFTNDYAGDLLYPTLVKFSFAKGDYDRRINDGLELVDARITNAVRCVPPENKPTPVEINTCRPFLEGDFATYSRLKVIIALGTIAHNSLLKTLGFSASAFKFGHHNVYDIQAKKGLKQPVTLIDSYHCSRYNVNTNRLTTAMFEEVVADARSRCDAA
ncbi:MAG TPA: uracil-DNA glycosylase [Alphaproteobacteria bacterium]|nr:uracil-DNA glycosylase [Alphaproteobacteria bacterium]